MYQFCDILCILQVFIGFYRGFPGKNYWEMYHFCVF